MAGGLNCNRETAWLSMNRGTAASTIPDRPSRSTSEIADWQQLTQSSKMAAHPCREWENAARVRGQLLQPNVACQDTSD
jgi:hypothetical protein